MPAARGLGSGLPAKRPSRSRRGRRRGPAQSRSRGPAISSYAAPSRGSRPALRGPGAAEPGERAPSRPEPGFPGRRGAMPAPPGGSGPLRASAVASGAGGRCPPRTGPLTPAPGLAHRARRAQRRPKVRSGLPVRPVRPSGRRRQGNSQGDCACLGLGALFGGEPRGVSAVNVGSSGEGFEGDPGLLAQAPRLCEWGKDISGPKMSVGVSGYD